MWGSSVENNNDGNNTDPLDRASRTSELMIAHSLDAHKNRPKEEPLIIDGVRCCVDCEEPIPVRRIELLPDAVRCVECQEVHEQYKRGFAR